MLASRAWDSHVDALVAIVGVGVGGANDARRALAVRRGGARGRHTKARGARAPRGARAVARRRLELAIGAARCHRKSVEIGYMYTGMWKVDTVNNYKCHWKGGCASVGIPEESIDKARVALEWYAWKDLHVGGRRLLSGEEEEEEDAWEGKNLRRVVQRRLTGDEEEDYEGDDDEEVY